MDIIKFERVFVLVLVWSVFGAGFVLASVLQSNTFCTQYTDSTLVGQLTGFNKVTPIPVNCPLGCELYLQATSALGFNGPLGSLGPLGQSGPVSVQRWTPTDQFAWIGDFSLYLNQLIGEQKLLSHPRNPLSSYGPLGDSFWDVMPNINDFTKHMQGMGIWSILGPLGPLGALGPLGPLGPVGAHGLAVNRNGEYIDQSGKIHSSVSAVFNSSLNITWPLFERYPSKEFVHNLSKKGLLDTSFMVLSETNTYGEEYIMTITEPQFISITVTPVVWAKNFFIQVYLNETLLFRSDGLFYTPWVQIYISEKDFVEKLQLKVIVKTDAMDCGLLGLLGCSMSYYLYVVGSTDFMLRRNHIPYTGPYIQDCHA